MIYSKLIPSILALATALSAACSTQAATALNASTISFAGMFFGAGNSGDHGAAVGGSWGARNNPTVPILSPIGGLAVSQVPVSTPSGSGVDTVSSKATASWTDADHGDFRVGESAFATLGDLSAVDFSPDARAEATSGFSNGRDFDYNFIATADGVLTLTSTISEVGDFKIGLGLWSVALAENPLDTNDLNPQPLFNGFGASTQLNSTLQFNLQKGKTYSLDIFNDEAQALSPITFEAADFSFSIKDTGGAGAVPEPATWSLLIAGFGGVGAMLRRHRRGFAYA